MSGSNKLKEVLFDLTDDALYVANGGRPFTRKGVIGICASHLSEKVDSDSDDYPPEDEGLISKIREREIGTYQHDRNRLTSDSRAEQEIGHDYGGRFVWELLQNADDVMGSDERGSADLIGSKGLGFKSVLEITEEPEIHSGPFHFRFSPDEIQQLLREKGISENPPRLTFRIPHVCPLNKKIRKLQNSGYSTIIHLPFQNETACHAAKSILKNLEPYFLLLSQELESVRILLDGEKPRLFRIERKWPGFSDGKVVLHTPKGVSSWQRWAATDDITEAKRLTAAIALPLDERGKAVSHADELPFHVFFPTEEQPGVKALLHASFDLAQNRKSLRNGDYDTEIIALFSEVLKRVIRDIPARTALETFGSSAPGEQNRERLLEKAKKAIREKMRTTPFVPIIGGGKVSPPDSTLWEDKLGKVLRTDKQEVKEAALVGPNLSDLSDVLKSLGAKEIEDSEYVRLLRYCRNESLKDCIASFQVLAWGGLERVFKAIEEGTLHSLRLVPCWWTENGQARPLEAERPLLWEKPENWPDWLPADSLHPKFRTEIERWEGEDEDDEWESLTNGFLSREAKEYIDWILIPSVERWNQKDWEKRGFRALQFFWRWEPRHNFDTIKPCIKEEQERRNKLATALFLPANKGWLPAIDCFADKAWAGPEAFDKFFKDQEEIGIVQAFEKWPKYLQKGDKDKWKGLLRWIGVSWEPKVCRTSDFTIPSRRRHRLWTGYSSGKWGDTRTHERRGKNYLIQDFPACVSKIEKKELIQNILPTLIELVSERALRYWSYRTGNNVYHSSEQAFALEQLCKEEWLPVKKSLLEERERIPPNETFLPGKGLGGLLPEVERSGIDDDTWHGENGVASKLRKLGVMDSLPDDSQKWHSWMRSLAEKKGSSLPRKEREAPSDWKDGGAKILWRGVRSLYREYLEREIPDPFPGDVKIPCVCLENGHRTLHFSLPEEVYWINEPHLMDSALEQKLLKRGYKLFIFRLKDGEQAERLGVQKLSNTIECHPHYRPSDDNETDTLCRRYAGRRVALEKVWKIELSETVAVKAVTDLELKLSTNKQDLGSCPVLSWKEKEASSILVDIGKNKWRALAHALAHRLDDGKYVAYINDFEVYLADDDPNSVLERARSAGVPEEALEEVGSSLQQLAPDGQPEETEEEDEERDITNTAADSPPEEQNEKSTSAPSLSSPPPRNAPPGPSPITSNGREAIPITRGADRRRQVDRQRSNGEDQANGPHPESGREAERWLEERLHKQWPDAVEKVHIGRDFTLLIGGRTVHIEAKHVESPPGSIHWSDRQYECAEQTNGNGDSYFIAVLSPDSENQYAVHWIWNPLEELKALERNLTWSGKSKPRPLQPDNWNVDDLKPPNVPSSNFSIEVELTDELFCEENQDSPRLERLKEKIEKSVEG